MLVAPIPDNEAERLLALDDHEIVDTLEEASFDGLTRLAAHVLGTPIALVSIVTRDRQWFKSKVGLDVRETSRDISFCSHVVASGEPLIVNDTRLDARFSDNPLVTGAPHVGFYVGLPLATQEGLVVGTLCVIDHAPRELTPQAQQLLELIAAQASAQLELRRKDRHLAREKRRLEASEARLLGVFEAMAEGVAVTDESGAVATLNPAAQRILGLGQASILDPERLVVRRADGSLFPESEWPIHRAFAAGDRSSGVLMQLERGSGVTWVSVNAARLSELDGSPAAIATFHDVTEQIQAQSKLQQSEASFRAVVACAPFGVVVVRDRCIYYVNDAMVRMFGYDQADQMVGRDALSLVHPRSLEKSTARLGAVQAGTPPPPGVIECVRKDGSIVEVESTMVSVDFDGHPALIGLVRDVSQQLRADAARQKAQDALRVSLGEKETLLQEVHHRVKNNLQVVASLINLQARQVADAGAREILEATKQRVQAIALLHEGLYRSSDFASVDLGPYLRGLAGDLLRANADPARGIAVTCDATGLKTDMDTAVPLGLIVNELVTNALKHAFKGRSRGKIEVRLEQKERLAELRVSDDGRGLPELFSLERTDSLGLRLVTNLARQLDGELALSAGPGVNWLLRFPLKGLVT